MCLVRYLGVSAKKGVAVGYLTAPEWLNSSVDDVVSSVGGCSSVVAATAAVEDRAYTMAVGVVF